MIIGEEGHTDNDVLEIRHCCFYDSTKLFEGEKLAVA